MRIIYTSKEEKISEKHAAPFNTVQLGYLGSVYRVKATKVTEVGYSFAHLLIYDENSYPKFIPLMVP